MGLLPMQAPISAASICIPSGQNCDQFHTSLRTLSMSFYRMSSPDPDSTTSSSLTTAVNSSRENSPNFSANCRSNSAKWQPTILSRMEQLSASFGCAKKDFERPELKIVLSITEFAPFWQISARHWTHRLGKLPGNRCLAVVCACPSNYYD